MTRNRSLLPTTATSVLVAGAALLLASTANAGLSCRSPSGSVRVGDQVTLAMSDNGLWPKVGDVYSMTATFYCSSGGRELYSSSVSHGSSFTIPSSFYGACSGNQIYAKYTGNLWDVAHWLHILPYWSSCDTMTVNSAPPPPPPPTTNPPPPTKDPEPPTNPTNPPTDPQPTQPPVTQPPNPEQPRPSVTNPPVIVTKTSEIGTLIPTVISGTTTLVPTTIIATINVTETILPPPATTVGSDAFDPNATLPPGLPPPHNGSNQNKSNSESHVPIAALASVAGVAALALIVFGFVMTRKRQRIRRERAAAAAAAEEEAAGGGSAVYARKVSSAEISMPSLIHSPFGFATSSTTDMPLPPAPAAAAAGTRGYVGMGHYDGSKESLPDSLLEAAAAAGAGSAAVAHAAAGRGGDGHKAELDDDVAAFPVPSTAHPTLVEELERTNNQARFSVASQDSTNVMAFPMPPITAPSQISLNGSDNASAITVTHVPLPPTVTLPVTGGSHDNSTGRLSPDGSVSYLETASPSHSYATATTADPTMESPSPTHMQVAASPASVFHTIHSNQTSSAYLSAADGDSPQLSSLTSTDLYAGTTELHPSDWRQSGRPESAHIRNLIRNVLEDDD
ncbi:hypothetical protein BGW41_000088 [Actinomortierella wolfii]|nr:hypothetical protein BGW41_000088 [Actinomortierella wolfii]